VEGVSIMCNCSWEDGEYCDKCENEFFDYLDSLDDQDDLEEDEYE